MRSRAVLSVSEIDELVKAALILARTIDQIVSTRAVESALHEPLSTSKVQVLRLLHRRGAQSLSQIARYLAVSKPAVTQIVDAMVREGLVFRSVARSDRRESHVKLAPIGRRSFLAIRDRQRHLIRSALRHANARSPEAWLGALRDVTVSLAKADQSFNEYCLQCGAHSDGSCVLVGGDAHCLFLEHLGGKGKKTRHRSG